MSVLTIFFCGTGSTSFDFANPDYYDGELVSTLARHHPGMEFVDWLIVDGPGSGNLQEDEKWDEPGNYWKLKGSLTGAGWEENVKHAMGVLKGEVKWQRDKLKKKEAKVLKRARAKAPAEFKDRIPAGLKKGSPRLITPQMLQQKKVEIMRGAGRPETAKLRAEFDSTDRTAGKITAVNLIGWSRGGVTCHMMANAMAKDPATRGLPVRIFANDPVPGAGGFAMHRAVLRSNVKDYIGVFSRDERSWGFTPVLPKLHGNTRRVLVSMPGRHATLVGNASNYGKLWWKKPNRFPEPGRITRDMAEKALRNWGTPLKKSINLTSSQIVQMYDKMLLDQRAYKSLRGKTYTFREFGDRDVGIGAAMPVFGTALPLDFDEVGWFRRDPVFVNSHHRWAFLRIYGNGGRQLLKGKGNDKTLEKVSALCPQVAKRIAALSG